jgi:serine/threonine protein kinase/Tol biopolymer transport system component
MEVERWQQIERLFHAALERAPHERAALLAEACAGDAELRHEVESLLAEFAHTGGLLEAAASDLAADWLQEQGRATLKQTLGHFRILSLLGKGGMGEVYLAEDLKLHRKVALKLLPAAFTEDNSRLRRFEQEARAASALNHPNIITIYEIGEADKTQFIATEHIEGQTLRALLRRGALPLKTVLDVAVQVVSALKAAHEAGILHRDIKPENIMVRADGLVKVLDFGLAKLICPPAANVDSKASTDVNVDSTPGMVMGTLAYMSPEQAQGLEVDGRSDIFSLGAVLYEIVKGQRAFRGDSQLSVLAAILDQEPEPLPAQVPQQLAKVILRCLRKDAARRYQTMADLKVELEDLREESTAGRKVQARARWPWTRVVLPVLIVLLLVAGFFAWQMWRSVVPAEPLQAVALTTLQGLEQFPSLSPDGTQVVFTWTEPKQDNQDIYVQIIGSDSRLRLTNDPRSDYNPVWSPDGLWIAFFRSPPPAPTGLRQRELWIVPPLSGPERKLADIQSQDFFPFAAYLAWSPDSKSLVVTDSPGEGQPDALFVVSLETKEKRPLTNPQPPVLADTSPAVSPDGRSLVFLRRTTWGSGELHLLPLGKDLTAEGEPKRLTSAQLRADFPAWMPDGKEIIFSAKGGLWRLTIPGENRPTRIPYVGEDGMMPVISRAQPGKPARLVYVRIHWDGNFWRIDTPAPGAPSPSPSVMAISSSKAEYHCQFSPDGRRVAFTSSRSGDPEIWVSDPDGSNAIKLTSLGGVDTNCAYWSPDGQFITFSSTGEDEWDVYVISAAGGKPRRLTSHPAIDIASKFSRDGQWIYFSSTRSGDYRVWKMPIVGGDAVQVTPNQGGGGAVESPDGSSIYYHMSSVVSPLWRLPTAGGEPVKVLDGVVWFNWCLFANGVYYIDYTDPLTKETRLQYLNFLTGKTTTVARNLGEVSAGLTVSPDGKTLLYTRVDSYDVDLMIVENFQ